MTSIFKSSTEQKVYVDLLWNHSVKALYEGEELGYKKARSKNRSRYTPDIVIVYPSGAKMYIEVKARLDSKSREKLLAVRQSNPGINLGLIVDDVSRPIEKGRTTTVQQWAKRSKIRVASRLVPQAWTID